jgi:hypothetical protein
MGGIGSKIRGTKYENDARATLRIGDYDEKNLGNTFESSVSVVALNYRLNRNNNNNNISQDHGYGVGYYFHDVFFFKNLKGYSRQDQITACRGGVNGTHL